MRNWICVIPLYCLTVAISFAQQPARQPPTRPVPGTYETTWVANSFANGTTHVPLGIEGICVLPDGHVFTNVDWDEGGGEISEFDAAGNVIAVGSHTHGWGYTGGSCIAANRRFLYFGQRVTDDNGGIDDPQSWPPKGQYWYGVARRQRSDIRKAAPFPGGKGGSGDTIKGGFLMIGQVTPPKDTIETRDPAASTAPRITALAVTDTRLFVADPFESRICVYDANSMAPIADYPNFPRVTAMAIAPDGTLWVAQSAGDDHPATVSALTQSLQGTALNINLADGVQPVALAVDPAGPILVADGGRASQIVTFDPHHLTGNPTTPARIFGTNLFAGIGPDVGKIAPGKFSDLTALGIDQAGDVYIASSVTGAVLEKYSSGGERLWARYALTFVDNSSIDPQTGDIFSSDEHYHFDWTKTAPGSEWSYVGKTLDRYRYPDDVRVYNEYQPFMRRLNGNRLYAFASNQVAASLFVYRFDSDAIGEIAIPCACIFKSRLFFHPMLAHGEFIWTDTNGDGRFDASEIQEPRGFAEELGDACWGWDVDTNGDIWQTVNGTDRGPMPLHGLRHFKLQGFDSRGTPKYSYDAMDVFPVPAPFLHDSNNGLERVIYDTATDTLYLGGYTQVAQHDTLWGCFRVLARYDHWLKGNRAPTWVINLPWHLPGRAHDLEVPISVAQAGDYLFVVGVKTTARVSVYRTSDGTYVGDLIPNNGLFTVAQTGWVDIRPFGIQATLMPDKSYAVLVEEDAYAKTIIYRWRP
jgi:hypothetical protein